MEIFIDFRILGYFFLYFCFFLTILFNDPSVCWFNLFFLAFLNWSSLFAIYHSTPGFISMSQNIRRNQNQIRPPNYIVENTLGDDSQYYQKDSFWCHECACNVPLRSKHCKICQNHVATYDHHCLILDTCIGERNYFRFYFFILFHFAGLLITFNRISTIRSRWVNQHPHTTFNSITSHSIQYHSSSSLASNSNNLFSNSSFISFLFLCELIVTSFLLLFLTILFSFHTYLISTGVTSHEFTHGPLINKAAQFLKQNKPLVNSTLLSSSSSSSSFQASSSPSTSSSSSISSPPSLILNSSNSSLSSSSSSSSSQSHPPSPSQIHQRGLEYLKGTEECDCPYSLLPLPILPPPPPPISSSSSHPLITSKNFHHSLTRFSFLSRIYCFPLYNLYGAYLRDEISTTFSSFSHLLSYYLSLFFHSFLPLTFRNFILSFFFFSRIPPISSSSFSSSTSSSSSSLSSLSSLFSTSSSRDWTAVRWPPLSSLRSPSSSSSSSSSTSHSSSSSSSLSSSISYLSSLSLSNPHSEDVCAHPWNNKYYSCC